MISFLFSHLETARTVATYAIAAAMVWAFCALTAAVVRTSSASSRHAAFWSPPRLQARSHGAHSVAYARRLYAAHARHAAIEAAPTLPELTAARTT